MQKKKVGRELRRGEGSMGVEEKTIVRGSLKKSDRQKLGLTKTKFFQVIPRQMALEIVGLSRSFIIPRKKTLLEAFSLMHFY